MVRYSRNKSLTILVALLLTLFSGNAASSSSPKRDFRGVWIQTAFQEQYSKLSTEENRRTLHTLLTKLKDTGINVVIFQVRPSADSFYYSELEPWSRFLSGSHGKAPDPVWDPLQFMIDECHSLGMELHAWLNPYRITTSANEKLPDGHFTKECPDRYVTFNRRLYFNPARQENRDHIIRVVQDIVSRYDVDGIHFDDYFYPYPNGNEKFADAADYKASGSSLSIGDWRRSNVDSLIKQVHEAITAEKPWVRFGISPFGIWRNKASDPNGSDTSGLQNYDDLFADVPKWAQNGWIDYQIPQLYWELDHKRASYRTLCRWWSQNGHGRHVYIGQDVKKTADAGELNTKLRLIAEAGEDALQGNCWWYATNIQSIAPKLKKGAYADMALVPEYLWLNVEPAAKPATPEYSAGTLKWTQEPNARKWVVYRFDDPEKIDIENSSAIVAITYTPEFEPTTAGCYVVTALDFANSESAPSLPLYIPSL